MISLATVVSVILYLVVAGLVFWLLWWLIGYCGLPEPFAKIANIVLAVGAVIVIISILFGLIGGQPIFRQ